MAESQPVAGRVENVNRHNHFAPASHIYSEDRQEKNRPPPTPIQSGTNSRERRPPAVIDRFRLEQYDRALRPRGESQHGGCSSVG